MPRSDSHHSILVLLRPLGLCALALATALALPTNPTMAQNEIDTVTVLPTNPTAEDSLILRFEGTWPTTCFPEFVHSTSLIGDLLEILLTAREDPDVPPTGCESVSTDFVVDVPIGELPEGSFDVVVINRDCAFIECELFSGMIRIGGGDLVNAELVARGNTSPELVAYGTWPAGCAPEFDRIEHEGDLIDIVATSDRSECDELETTPFAVAADLGVLPVGDFTARFVVEESDAGVDPAKFVRASLPLSPEYPTSVELLDGDYLVSVEFTDPQRSGSGRLVPNGTESTALFWFFTPDNWELLVKVLDTCAFSDFQWVFTAASTNVAYTLRVEHVPTGTVREYTKEQGPPAAAVTDTEAFAVCD